LRLITLDRFLVFRGDDLPNARIAPPLALMITQADFFVKNKRSEIDNSRTRCLLTSMRSSIQCMFFVGQIRGYICDAGGPRAMVGIMFPTEPRAVTTSFAVTRKKNSYPGIRRLESLHEHKKKILSW
jgi:hypothetical protein